MRASFELYATKHIFKGILFPRFLGATSTQSLLALSFQRSKRRSFFADSNKVFKPSLTMFLQKVISTVSKFGMFVKNVPLTFSTAVSFKCLRFEKFTRPSSVMQSLPEIQQFMIIPRTTNANKTNEKEKKYFIIYQL